MITLSISILFWMKTLIFGNHITQYMIFTFQWLNEQFPLKMAKSESMHAYVKLFENDDQEKVSLKWLLKTITMEKLKRWCDNEAWLFCMP